MTSSMLAAPPTARPDDAVDGPADGRAPLVRPYLGYVGYFVGAGLISGGIVHFPLDRGFYAAVACAGVALFLAATVLNEFVLSTTSRTLPSVARVIASSLLLSLGIGMLSGGIQHFTDFPTRSATLVPVGLALSFAAYTLRHGAKGQPRRLAVMSGAVVALAVAAHLGLGALAAAVDGGGHGHGHAPLPAGSSAGTDEHGSEHESEHESEHGSEHGTGQRPDHAGATQGGRRAKPEREPAVVVEAPVAPADDAHGHAH